MSSESEGWEAELAECCRAAGMSPLQRECLLYWLVDDLSVAAIRLKLHAASLGEIRAAIEQALARLDRLPDFWGEANRFPARLVFCAADRRTYDERPDGISGVTPDRAADRLHGGPLVAADDPRLRQDLVSAARMWVNNKRPKLLREPEAA